MGASESKPPQITIHSFDADVPIVPPIVLLLLLSLAAILARYVDQLTFVPEVFDRGLQKIVRTAVFVVAFGVSISQHLAALDEMHAAGSGLAFTPTASVATGGPFAITRNPFYTLLIFVQLPALAVLFDCGWLIVAIAPMFVWLSKVVIPGEEAFLTRNFGQAYTDYTNSTPRWIF